jgi:hypothetical protein
MAQQETKQLNQIVVGADERSLYRLLRFLASHGLFRKTVNGAFDHTPSSSVLRSDAVGSYRAGAQMFHHIFAAWDGLDHAVRTGEPGFNTEAMLAAYDFGAIRVLADIGGGNGSLISCAQALSGDAGNAVRLGACGGTRTRTPEGEWAHRPLRGDRGQFL